MSHLDVKVSLADEACFARYDVTQCFAAALARSPRGTTGRHMPRMVVIPPGMCVSYTNVARSMHNAQLIWHKKCAE